MKTTHSTQRLYTEKAATYERLFVGFLGWGRELQAFFRRYNYARPNSKVLDAGCGTGVVTRMLYRLAREERYEGIEFHAFDLTANMLQVFRQWIARERAENIELRQADVLALETLPSHWEEYDLIVVSTMLEYLPRDQVERAVTNLTRLLKNGGSLVAMITRRTALTRWLAGKWWKANIYEESEIQRMFRGAGLEIEFRAFSPGWSKFIIAVEAKKG